MTFGRDRWTAPSSLERRLWPLTAWLVLLSLASVIGLGLLPIFVMVGAMACDAGCSNATAPLALMAFPISLSAGALLGWYFRSRMSPWRVVACSLAPALADIVIVTVGFSLAP